MRSFRQIPSRYFGKAARILAVTALLPLAGCGFRPMDAHDGNETTPAKLTQVDVKRIPNRLGRVVRTELSRRFNPTGVQAPPAYALSVTCTETLAGRGTRTDDSATQIDHVMDAMFDLTTIGTEETPSRPLLRGNSQAVSRSNRPSSLYATYVSDEAASARAAKLLAEDVARQVALYFRYADRYSEPKPTLKPDAEASPARPNRP